LCAQLAVQPERTERCEVWGEPRLRAAELEADRSVASARMGELPDGRPGCGGRISCCFPMRRCRSRSRSSSPCSSGGGRRSWFVVLAAAGTAAFLRAFG
jgi:hypothetical protein